MIEDYEKITARTEHPPYPCKMCGLFKIERSHMICKICDWQDDGWLEYPDCEGGVNGISFNQHRAVWLSNRQLISNYSGFKTPLIRELLEVAKKDGFI